MPFEVMLLGMEKGLGIVVVFLIWGGLLYFLMVNNPSIFGSLTGSSLASALSSFGDGMNSQKGVVSVLDEQGNFKEAAIHFDKKIDILDVVFSPDDPNLIFAGSNYGLFVSRDGGLNWYNFSDVEHKINSETTVYKIIFNNSEAFISVFSGDKGTVYLSRDNFFSLEKILDFDNEAVYNFGVTGSDLYLGLSNGQLLVYSLNNKEWRLLKDFGSPITRLDVSQNGLIYVTLKNQGFWLSRDKGLSFIRLSFLDNYKGANKINDISLCPSGCSLMYAATDYGLIKSSDGGISWQVFKSLPKESTQVSAVAVLYNPGEIFAAAGEKIYKSANFGVSWQVFDPGFKNRQISVIQLDGKQIILGTKSQ